MLNKLAEYFINPLAEGYTFGKTLFYFIFFLIISVVAFKIANKNGVKINLKLFFSFLPYLTLASTVRVLRDYLILESSIFVTPWIQILFLIPFFLFLFLCRKFNQEILQKIFLIFSLILLGIALSYLPIKNSMAIVLSILILIFSYFIVKKIKYSHINKLLVFSIIYEFSITIVNVFYFNFYEQHFLTRYIMENFPILYPLTRIIIALLLIKTLDNYIKETQTNNFFKIYLTTISLSIGIRNCLQAIACC
ncbi:MAG: DUF63 family protein [Nanopusillaceae archaeon]